MTAIKKLDSLYAISLERELTVSERNSQLLPILKSVVTTCKSFLEKIPGRLNSFRKHSLIELKRLAAEECVQTEKKSNNDVLCHYSLMRELMESTMLWVKRGYPLETFS